MALSKVKAHGVGSFFAIQGRTDPIYTIIQTSNRFEQISSGNTDSKKDRDPLASTSVPLNEPELEN
jgi:hypothetical protein